MNEQCNPEKIMQIGMGFMASKVLLTATKLDIFTHLAKGPMSGNEIKEKFGLHKGSIYDFLDTLVALGFLTREGLKESAKYGNAEDTNIFLDKNKPSYVGGLLLMANDRLYKYWGNLEDGLKTGEPQNEIKETGEPLFMGLYSNPEKVRAFLNAMNGIQIGNFMTLANKFDFSKYETLCDVGGGSGLLACQIAQNHENIVCTTYDLKPVEFVANETIKNYNVSNVKAVSGDFFKDVLPKAEIITMCNILHDWNLEQKKFLLKKAYDALPENGVFIAVENIIDDERKENVLGLLISLNMLIETGDGFDFSHADFDLWAKDIGFKQTEKMPLMGSASAVIAYK